MKLLIVFYVLLLSLKSESKQDFSFQPFIWESRVYHDGGIKGKNSTESKRLFQMGFDSQNSKENWDWNLGIIASVGDEPRLYLKENAHTLIRMGGLKMGLGRFLFPSLGAMGGRRDGAESGFIEWKSGNSSIRVFLADHYRGFPLFEKEFLRPEINLSESKKMRMRHSIEGQFHFGIFDFQLFFHYVDLGNFGNQSQEIFANRSKGGDHDILYYFDPSIGWKSANNELILSYSYLRGMDRTLSHTGRVEPTIPISGQRLSLTYGYQFKDWYSAIRFFLPNGEKSNHENQILQYGYVGMGANPSQGPFSGQILNYYPSPWVTQEGLSWNRGFFQGREASFWMEWESKFEYSQFEYSFIYNYFLPRLNLPDSKGLLTAYKRDFAKESLQELKFAIQSKNSLGIFRIEFSHFQISNQERTNGQGINLMATKSL
jgi:hypothetical protein